MIANIQFKILHYEGRSWYRRKYDVRMSALGFMVPDTHWSASFWTLGGARRFTARQARNRDFKVIDNVTMEHEG